MSVLSLDALIVFVRSSQNSFDGKNVLRADARQPRILLHQERTSWHQGCNHVLSAGFLFI